MLKIDNLKLIIVLAFCVVTLNACSSASPSTTPPPTRLATQTPWIIYVPVTNTPEPATVTPLPTATDAKPTVRATATRAPAVAKPAATATKPPAAVAVVPTATPVPVCPPGLAFPAQQGVRFPENGALRRTKTNGPGPDTFDFKWVPFQQDETDGQLGYRIEIQSKKGTQVVNGDTVDVQHNWFINNGKHFIYDARRVYNLASAGGGDSVAVTWTVSIIKATGGYSNQGQASGTVTKCGASLDAWLIDLQVVD